MIRTLPRLVWMALVLGIVCACGKTAQALPTCPLFCIFSPDPVPPPPSMPVGDPPFRALTSQGGGSNSQARTAAPAAAQAARVTVAGKLVEGGECESGKVEGTLVKEGGKFMCNFKPSTLKVGGACHALKRLGTVTVIEGKRYCQLAP